MHLQPISSSEYQTRLCNPIASCSSLSFPSILTQGRPYPSVKITGTVVASGSAASFDVREVGTRVVAYQNVSDMVLFGRGALVEYVRLPSRQAAQPPERCGRASMAGVLGSGSTALKMARTCGIRQGQHVLINGGGQRVRGKASFADFQGEGGEGCRRRDWGQRRDGTWTTRRWRYVFLLLPTLKLFGPGEGPLQGVGES